MADFQAVSAVGTSLGALLTAAFDQRQPIAQTPTKVAVVRTNDLDLNENTEIVLPAVSLLLYRIEVNRSTRAGWSAQGATDGRAYLPLDLHYLVTAWADNAEHEHLILGRAVQVLQSYPVLDGLLLHPSGGWDMRDTVETVFEEVPLEDLMRTFDALEIHYRLSLPYLARVVVVAQQDELLLPEVLTSRVEVGTGVSGR